MPTISKIMILRFTSPILKDEYVSHTSVYNGSCNRCVNTNRSDAPISKNLSTTMSILNNVVGSLKRVFQYLTKYCTFVQYALSRSTRRNM
jgi:hypothetical protein